MSEVASRGAAPRLIEGGLGIDDRGQVAFVNEFDFAGVKRFYVVSNHGAGFVRAWHAHRREAKYVTLVQGSAIVAAVEIVSVVVAFAGACCGGVTARPVGAGPVATFDGLPAVSDPSAPTENCHTVLSLNAST